MELWLFYYSDFVCRYRCHLPSVHWWKPCASCLYTNCEMSWWQDPHNGACGIRIRVLFEMLSLLCFFSVLELLQPVTLSRPHWPASGAFGLPTAISSTHLNDHWHISINLYLTDLICNGNSFQILGFTVHPCMFCYLYTKHKTMFEETW